MTPLAQLGPAAQAQAAKQIGEQEKKRQKYGAQPTMVDGIRFASKREAQHYARLAFLQKIGQITDLKLQMPFPLIVNEVKICVYIADFTYREEDGELVVADAKGVLTPVYRIKKKLMLALHNIEILET